MSKLRRVYDKVDGKIRDLSRTRLKRLDVIGNCMEVTNIEKIEGRMV